MPELPQINEKFGLAIGDRALRASAERLRGLSRSEDVCGRYTDTTFLCITEAKGDAGLLVGFCRRLAEQLRFRIDLDMVSLNLSARVGAAPCGPAAAPSGEDLVQLAQQALQKARSTEGSFFVLGSSDAAGFEAAPGSVPQPSEPLLTPPLSDSRTSDRRRNTRQRVFKRGQIIIGLDSTIDCTVRNVSPSGAGLRLDAPFTLADEFELLIVGTGARRRVRVRWQIGRDLGVEYVA